MRVYIRPFIEPKHSPPPAPSLEIKKKKVPYLLLILPLLTFFLPLLFHFQFSSQANQVFLSYFRERMNYNFPSAMTNPTSTMPSIPAVGYRFHPSNEELVNNYLKPKILGNAVEDLAIIPEVHVCEHEPWDLPYKSNIKSNDAVWHFFCPRDLKYVNSRRSNRRTKLGYWKPTGKILKIRVKGTKKVIGTKKTLVFYRTASPKHVRTGWIIHEYDYISDLSLSNQGEYVLCKLKTKSDEKIKKGEPNHHMVSVSDFEAESSCSIEGESGPFMEMPSQSINHSNYGNEERSRLLDFDFDNQKLDKETCISAPDEGERDSLTVMPSNLETRNPWEKTGVLTLEEGCLRRSVFSRENSPIDASPPELLQLVPQLREELKALLLELENSLDSPLQPAASASTEEIPSYMGFDTSLPTLTDPLWPIYLCP